MKQQTIFLTIALLILGATGYVAYATAPQGIAKTLAVCEQAHDDTISSDSVIKSKWSACYNSEKTTNSTFMCSAANTNCWIEVATTPSAKLK